MLAARRALKLDGKEVAKTPLLVPSFSSKGFPEAKQLLEISEELITDTLLVSAYDLHYEHLPRSISFPEFIFLDSGGYECSKDTEFSDLGLLPHAPKNWTEEMHRTEVDLWPTTIPTVLISYDHPAHRIPVQEQIERAQAFFRGRPVIPELLIKAETKDQKYVQVDNVIANVHRLAGFGAIGFTEKELGRTVLKRMESIARIRTALNKANIHIPIHIFGSLDTISTPLYFLSGADIFDGLTWLRMAYKDGYTMYYHNCAVLDFGPTIPDDLLKARILFQNYYALQDLQSAMRRFLNAREFREFPHHSEFFERTFHDLTAQLGGS